MLAGCAAPGSSSAVDPGAEAPTEVPAGEVVFVAGPNLIIQQDGGEPELCLGGVNESLPPQCGGPVLVGLDWDDVGDAETVGGVTFGSGWVVGTFDGETFTLSEPVSTDPPAGAEPPTAGQDFEPYAALCEDPYRGGTEGGYPTETFPEGEGLGPDGLSAMSQLQERAWALPGYVEMFVSDGNSEVNVLLTAGSDVEAAHASLREVWSGWLCVDTKDVLSNAEGQAASQALSDGADGLDLLAWGADTIEGTFYASVVLDDPATVATIHEILAPWYSPDQILIDSALKPLATS